MQKQQAIDLIRSTFQTSFDRNRLIKFVKELLNTPDIEGFNYSGNIIPDAFDHYISQYERIAKYTDADKKRIDVLIVYLKRKESVERARSMQRNFIAGYLSGKYGSDSEKDAALVAFVTPDREDWRFSLVKMEHNFVEAEGKIKVKDEYSPARRWSFLVGSHEKSHTAQRQLQPLLEDDEHNPTLKQFEEAFNIETVTKEFFIEYRRLFIWTKEEMDKAIAADPKTKADFESKGIDTVNFSKKLLGQIVFLYFLQKKGWFGVPKDAAWGEGSKNFLRELFEKKHSDYKNFFNDILEPLFYEALRNDRSYDKHYYSRFDCKIPFLNGGLFDPLNNYDWVETNILLSNKLFSNTARTSAGDEGNGILDVFDRYNFTVREDEPFEKEVAIDPELLGKAYEKFNAIRPDNYADYLKALKSGKKGDESKFNKQYGVYYTPREIVHYMCQQSLINYLYTELNTAPASYQKIGEDQTQAFDISSKDDQLDLTIEHRLNPAVPKEDIETLILHGEHLRENDARVAAKGRETKDYAYQTPVSIRRNAALIDEKLAAIRVCDPAVGSGAFPVGMMSEIVRAREVLKTWTKTNKTTYDFKRECIENSLYGVDIDAGAVEIAKLRLWLSLVVDEDDPQNIKPLPNLDYKIVCGNSLIGIEKNLFNNELFSELEKQKPIFFNETNPTKKQEYKNQINGLIKLITNGHKEFDFEIYFSEVFHEKGGFDVVIGNPPYLESRHPDFNDDLKELYQASTKRRWKEDVKYVTRGSDLLIYFFENAIFNVNHNGCIILITQNSWLDTEYGKKFQNFLLKNTQVRLVIDSDFRYFASGDGPNINAVITLFIGKNSKSLNTITFARYHASFGQISNLIDQEDSPFVDTNKYAYTNNLLQEVKWGILLSSSKETLALFDLLRKKASKIEDIKECRLSFGQGLNLSKDYLVDSQILSAFPYARKAAIPLLTSDDGAVFNIQKTARHILDKTKLTKQELQEIKAKGIIPFDLNSTSKKPPKLIMPRGISTHFCAFNPIGCYSSSCVDLYDIANNAAENILLNLWLFFNSSLFWLLREISGRKNLGGGLLKSEAVDLESMHVYMDFQNTKEIKKLLEKLSKRQALVTVDEIDTDEHRQIDDIVFDYLSLEESERINIISTLKQKITDRKKKAST